MFTDVLRLIVSVILTVAVHASFASADTHDFYKGKTIRIVVGFTAGGAFDVYSRTIARYMGQHIPGSSHNHCGEYGRSR